MTDVVSAPSKHVGGPIAVVNNPAENTVSQPDDASFMCPEYRSALPLWQRVRAACEGQDAVKALTGVLPELNPEDTTPRNATRNRQYLERAVYFNATGRTKEGLIGLAFAKDPDVNFGSFDYLADDANQKGSSIYHLAQEGLSGILQTGRYGFLTDIVNEKPSIVGYPAESIINWRFEEVNGKKILRLLVLLELVQEPDGDYGVKYFNQYRVYRNTGTVTCQIYRRETANNGEVKLIDSPSISKPNARIPGWDIIPFSFCGATTNSPDVDRAPLLSLADMNLAHFRNSADFEDSVFLCGQPQAFITNLDIPWRDHLEEKGCYIGSRMVMLLPLNSTFGFAQAEPNTLAKEAMDQKKAEMVALGARVVEENKVTKTATQAAGDIATGTSVLGLCCANVSEAVTRAMQWLGVFANDKPFTAAKFAMTQDFSVVTADPQMVTAIVEAWQSGAIGTVDKNNYLKKGGVIAPERKDEEIQEDVESTQEFLQPIMNPAPPVDPNQIPAKDKLKIETKKADKPPPKPQAKGAK